MSGQAPSWTMRADSSAFMPRKMKCRVKLPDCEEPRMIVFAIFVRFGEAGSRRGFLLPKSSAVAYRKNDMTSRKAAVPAPSTYGFFTL